MKIVAIIGSPRKGNTYKTIQLVEQIHKDIVDCEYEYIFLKDINLLPCKGCFVCISNGEEFCPLKDDNEWLSRRIEDADGVIVSSPNYAANVTSLMKNYIDRNAYICHRPKFFGKKFMLVVSSGSTMGIRAASKALSILVSGGKIVSRLHVITSPSLSSSQKKKEELKIRKVSKQFANKLCHSQRNRHPFSYLIWFSVFKAASNRSKKHFRLIMSTTKIENILLLIKTDLFRSF
jgi:multimeric flavodoxin WrbA